MKINVANPGTGSQKVFEFDDEKKFRIFYDKRMASEVALDSLGDEWVGYVAKISGGNDKQGFPMMQGVLVNGRVRLLLDNRHKTYRPRRKGERKRKSVRGCIVGPDLAMLNLVILKKGEKEIPGLTDRELPQRLGPKRASKIRKLFNLEKEDDVRKYVVRRVLPKKEGKRLRTKAPKIQRLVTPRVLQHKRRIRAHKIAWAQKSREEAAEYAKLLAVRRKETKSKRSALISARRSERASSKKSETEEKKSGKTKRTDESTAVPSPTAKKAQPPTKRARVVAKKVEGAKPVKSAKKTAKPTAESGAKKTAKPTAESGAKKTAKPAAESGAKKTAKPTATSGAKKTAKPAAESGAKTAKPTATSGAKKTTKPKPTAASGAKKTTKPAAGSK